MTLSRQILSLGLVTVSLSVTASAGIVEYAKCATDSAPNVGVKVRVVGASNTKNLMAIVKEYVGGKLSSRGVIEIEGVTVKTTGSPVITANNVPVTSYTTPKSAGAVDGIVFSLVEQRPGFTTIPTLVRADLTVELGRSGRIVAQNLNCSPFFKPKMKK